MADDVLSAFLLSTLDHTDHSIDVSKVVSRLCNLGLIGSIDTADLGALLLQRLNDGHGGHVDWPSGRAHGLARRVHLGTSLHDLPHHNRIHLWPLELGAFQRRLDDCRTKGPSMIRSKFRSRCEQE